ncbi:unnamed protein product [Mesocestoides corti]|uniref:Peptidase A2 domain-containing protein n=1 Tax=Mesocestoides corti TaxID=53468 RepID=A0A0R3U7H6_MESCO|nr:unnamed protein product [Mesocestoides corti]
MLFLIDSGANISVVPPTRSEKRSYKPFSVFSAASGLPILTNGQRSIRLALGLRRQSRWVFTIAAGPIQSLVQIFSTTLVSFSTLGTGI